jgi:hypothetical protein
MKTVRASEHLKALQADCLAFREDAYTVLKYDDPQKSLHICRVELKPCTTDIPIAIGEYAYALRSALDHLAWQLGLLSGRTPSRSSAFPIHATDSVRDRERFMRATWDIPCAAVDVIKALQPYQRGKAFKTHPLWQLNKLCNIDKHMTISFAHTEIIVDTAGPPVDLLRREGDYGVELAVALALKDKVEFKPKPPKLVFGRPIESPGPEFMLSEEEVAEIHRFVSDEALPLFARFFDGRMT